jgi:hypothetical protein
MAIVARGIRDILRQREFWLPDWGASAHHYAFEIALDRRRKIRAIFLNLQLCFNTNPFEIVLDQLSGIQKIRTIATRGMQ